MPQLQFSTLDVFTTTPYAGNPLAIIHARSARSNLEEERNHSPARSIIVEPELSYSCTSGGELTPFNPLFKPPPTVHRTVCLLTIQVPTSVTLTQEQKQKIAREFNLSESVFLHEQTAADASSGTVHIDIFTPYAEIPFAGHPTIGTSNYLLHIREPTSHPSPQITTLVTKAGRIPIHAHPTPRASTGAQLSIPHAIRIHASPFADTPFAHFPVVSIVRGMTFILARQPDLAALAAQTGNLLGNERTYTAAERLDEGWRVGIISTHFYVDMGFEADGDADGDGNANGNANGAQRRVLRTRGLGSMEDPATGSAASALCSYLSLEAAKADATGGANTSTSTSSEADAQPTQSRRYKYHLNQGVEMGRSSHIFIEVGVGRGEDGEPVVEEVLLSGNAVRVMQGTVEV